MKKGLFEQYLEEQFMKTHPEILDDDLSDALDTWLSQLDADEYIEHGNEAMKKSL